MSKQEVVDENVGEVVQPPPLRVPPLRGGTKGGAYFILHLNAFSFLRKSTFYTLHCIALTQTKRLRKKILFCFTTIPFKALFVTYFQQFLPFLDKLLHRSISFCLRYNCHILVNFFLF